MKDAEFAFAVFSTDIDSVGGSATQSGSFMGLSDVRHCGKMRALERLMHSWISMGDKILLFSYSVRLILYFFMHLLCFVVLELGFHYCVQMFPSLL